jgi:phosphoribosylformylglycinamidine synthase
VFLARVYVTLKPTVNDPQGLTIKGGLHSLGFDAVETVRAGKYLEIRLDAADRAAAEAQVTEMCRKLLANPVIEDFRFQIEEQGAGNKEQGPTPPQGTAAR